MEIRNWRRAYQLMITTRVNEAADVSSDSADLPPYKKKMNTHKKIRRNTERQRLLGRGLARNEGLLRSGL